MVYEREGLTRAHWLKWGDRLSVLTAENQYRSILAESENGKRIIEAIREEYDHASAFETLIWLREGYSWVIVLDEELLLVSIESN